MVLRPEPGASATAERARRRGLNAIAIPMFEVEPVIWEVPDPGDFDALLLTSANAIRHGGPGLVLLNGLPVHAVGAATSEAARDAGFEVATGGDSGVEALLASLAPSLKLLHLCGEDRARPAHPRQKITAIAVYRARETLAPDLAAAQGAVVLVHSPRAGRRLAELIGDRGSVAIAAISRAAAEAAGQGWETIEAAGKPNDDALLALAERLCNKPQRT